MKSRPTFSNISPSWVVRMAQYIAKLIDDQKVYMWGRFTLRDLGSWSSLFGGNSDQIHWRERRRTLRVSLLQPIRSVVFNYLSSINYIQIDFPRMLLAAKCICELFQEGISQCNVQRTMLMRTNIENSLNVWIQAEFAWSTLLKICVLTRGTRFESM